MQIETLIHDIGSYTNEAIVIAEADTSDGAILLFRWINSEFVALTGYTDKFVRGRTAGILTGESTDRRRYAKVITDLQEWKTFDAELRLYRASGESFWAHLTFRPIKDADGIYRYWIMTLRDVTQRKMSENALTDLSLIARATGDMVFVLDRQRRIDWVNDSFVKSTGYTLDDVRGKRAGAVLQADTADAQAVAALVERLDKRLPHKAEILSKRKDGGLFIAEYEYQPTYDDNGHFTKYVLLVRDITQRVLLEKRYKAVFDETNTAISVKSGGAYLMVNRRFAELFAMTPDDFTGQPEGILAGSRLSAALQEAEAKVLATGESRTWEASFATAPGKTLHLLTKTFRRFDDVLNTHTVCSVVTDVTEIRQTERALNEEQEKAWLAQQRLWSAIEGLPDGFILYDDEDRVVHANRAFIDMHGAISDRICPGATFESILRDGLAAGLWNTEGASDEDWLAARLAARANGTMAKGCYLGLDNGGWMLTKEIRLDNGERAGIRIDATQIKRTEGALYAAQQDAQKAEARLLGAISVMDSAFSIYGPDDRLVVSNVNYLGKRPDQVRGMSFEEIITKALKMGRIKIPEGVRHEDWIAARVLEHENPGAPLTQEMSDGRIFRVVERKTERGDTVTMRIDLTHERKQQARLESYAGDLERSKLLLEGRNADLERVRKSLEHSSRHDSLTGLPNRRYLEQELQRLATGPDAAKLAVLHMDLDRFKQINDAFGHAAGDHVLNEAARILQDVTGPDGFCARVGGDEFVVLCIEQADGPRASDLASDLIFAFRQPMRFGLNECRVGASIGIAFNTKDRGKGTPGQLLIDADIALYRAKGSGRNRWAVFSQSLQSEVLASKRLSDDILRGLDAGEFTAVYQPQVRASDFRFCGVEALLRWNHPERGLLHPTSFLEAAEDLSVVAQLDEIVFARAAADDAFWRANGQTIPSIAVNVSDSRLRSPDFIKDIQSLGVDPARLSIELLETIFLDDDDSLLSWTIDQLREMGVSIELDDFGTGHSSIIGLLKLKPHRVKIDKSFIDQILGAQEAEVLLQSIINIGRTMDVEIVAEGIETLPHAERLRDMGCDILQGYVFAEAMSAQEVLDFAREALVPQVQHQN